MPDRFGNPMLNITKSWVCTRGSCQSLPLVTLSEFVITVWYEVSVKATKPYPITTDDIKMTQQLPKKPNLTKMERSFFNPITNSFTNSKKATYEAEKLLKL